MIRRKRVIRTPRIALVAGLASMMLAACMPSIGRHATAASAATPESAIGPADILRPVRLYHGIGQPIEITVVTPTPAAVGTDDQVSLSLVLLDAAGSEITRVPDVEPGRIDLARMLPALLELKEAAWLQLRADGVMIGSPLVVEPMLARLVPVAREAQSPGGFTYTEIDGWAVEANGWHAAKSDPATIPPDATGPVDPETAERLLTGHRIYVDRHVRLATSEGDMVVRLRPDAAPNTAWNFRHLAENGFYRGITFHRIVPVDRNGDPFVIQAGDPTGTGDGGPGWWLPMERSTLQHDVGVISMARDVDPDSAGSQFFFCLSREGTARLDGNYVAFGELIEGLDVMQRIAASELADPDSGKPAEPVVIRSAVLETVPPMTLTTRPISLP